MYSSDGLVIDYPLTFLIFLKWGLLQTSSGLEVIIAFGVTKFDVLLFLWVWLAGSCKGLA